MVGLSDLIGGLLQGGMTSSASDRMRSTETDSGAGPTVGGGSGFAGTSRGDSFTGPRRVAHFPFCAVGREVSRTRECEERRASPTNVATPPPTSPPTTRPTKNARMPE